MPRGGKRPGAGAPRGNLNGLKSGRYSKQVQALKLALRAVPRTADVLRGLGSAGDQKRAQMARALHLYAELLVADPVLIQSIDLANPDPAQIRKLLRIDESNQAIKRRQDVGQGPAYSSNSHMPDNG